MVPLMHASRVPGFLQFHWFLCSCMHFPRVPRLYMWFLHAVPVGFLHVVPVVPAVPVVPVFLSYPTVLHSTPNLVVGVTVLCGTVG